MTRRGMNRRSFLKLPAPLPLTSFGVFLRLEEHCFQYERIIPTSLDLVVWTKDSKAAESACRTVLEEIDRLASILDTRNPDSEISKLETSGRSDVSYDLSEVLCAYDYWHNRTGGIVSVRPDGICSP